MDTQVMAIDTTTLSPYWLGFNAYCAGAQLEDVPPQQRRGWWAALDAQAGAEMPVKESRIDVVAEADEYADDILDREYWSKGQW